MTEAEIQKELARVLDHAGLCWTATANGGKRDKRTAASLKAQGLKPGVPDILIFNSPPHHPEAKGLALELKRAKGGRASPHQKIWISELERLGWIATITHGLDQALDELIKAGYLDASTYDTTKDDS